MEMRKQAAGVTHEPRMSVSEDVEMWGIQETSRS